MARAVRPPRLQGAELAIDRLSGFQPSTVRPSGVALAPVDRLVDLGQRPTTDAGSSRPAARRQAETIASASPAM